MVLSLRGGCHGGIVELAAISGICRRRRFAGLAVIFGITGGTRIVGLAVIFVRGGRVGVGVVMFAVLPALGGFVGGLGLVRGGGVAVTGVAV